MSHGLYFIESKDQTVALCPAGRKREKLTQIAANVEGCLQNLQMQYDVGSTSSVDFTNLYNNSEDATIFGTPAKSASEQWVV